MACDPGGIVHNNADIDDIINNDHPWHLLSVTQYSECFTYINSFNFCTYYKLSRFYRPKFFLKWDKREVKKRAQDYTANKWLSQ